MEHDPTRETPSCTQGSCLSSARPPATPACTTRFPGGWGGGGKQGQTRQLFQGRLGKASTALAHGHPAWSWDPGSSRSRSWVTPGQDTRGCSSYLTLRPKVAVLGQGSGHDPLLRQRGANATPDSIHPTGYSTAPVGRHGHGKPSTSETGLQISQTCQLHILPHLLLWFPHPPRP